MKPTSNHNESGFMKSNLHTSKNILTFGYITNPSMNLTVTVTPPISFDDQFKEFWSVYGQSISIFAGGFAGDFALLVFAKIKKTDNQYEDYKRQIDLYDERGTLC